MTKTGDYQFRKTAMVSTAKKKNLSDRTQVILKGKMQFEGILVVLD